MIFQAWDSKVALESAESFRENMRKKKQTGEVKRKLVLGPAYLSETNTFIVRNQNTN